MVNWKLRFLSGRICTGFKWLRTRVIGQLLGYYAVESGQELDFYEASIIIIIQLLRLLFRATNAQNSIINEFLYRKYLRYKEATGV